ncbi:TetR/AcrR family transcriptional regulator [Nocardioides daeguensis]|uniref:HTH tetR-type domain-containing protein n=1 Tax=Nocardioides daeguensis TaxID=908359 RepID=A0ABP6V493_9ACTN|nr:TetR family transcriptional regulator C-terminal domain-containing protein [Nocardioides daeguensis]MBV6726555.1 TetR family transcriptional regulator C-terminal domain-containing protein [Nocardioides daeguensis]MCR1772398.1 TetR family transcriptional regulator C-terminal domain-containing protein [Nocardioides daeguensis]
MARVAAEDRRRLLVEAAIRVMVRDGVSRATTRAIVGEADMALAAFHYCFRSKAELLELVAEEILARTLSPALEIVTGEGSVEERVRSGVASYWSHVVEHPDEHRLTYEITQYVSRTDGLEELAARQYRGYVEAHLRLLEALTEQDGIELARPAEDVARYLAAVVDGITLLYLNEGDADAAAAALGVAVDHLLGLLGG